MGLIFAARKISPRCRSFEFPCLSGECIAVYDTCNGIEQCRDGSDESPQLCPATTEATTRRPTVNVAHPRPDVSSPKRPSNINQWGREGEKYNPYKKPKKQQQESSSVFQHKGSNGVQINSQSQKQSPSTPYGSVNVQSGTYAPYGYPGILDYSGYGYGYPQVPAPNGYLLPNVYTPSNPSLQVRMPPNAQQTKVSPKKGAKASPTSSGGSDSVKNTKEKSTSSAKAAPTTAATNDDEYVKQYNVSVPNNINDGDAIDILITKLKPALMTTPSAAVFTLVTGCSLTLALALFVACRMRHWRRSPNRKRNMAAEADGDYLVNGMYL